MLSWPARQPQQCSGQRPHMLWTCAMFLAPHTVHQGPQQAGGGGPWPSTVASTVLTRPASWGRRLRPVSSPQVATSSRNCSTVARSQMKWPSSSLAALTSLAPALLLLPRARCCRAAARCSLAPGPPHWPGPCHHLQLPTGPGQLTGTPRLPPLHPLQQGPGQSIFSPG